MIRRIRNLIAVIMEFIGMALVTVGVALGMTIILTAQKVK